jgi:glutamate synthase domain-containing protein 3
MAGLVTFDLSKQTVRELNHFLHRELGRGATSVRVTNPNGLHSIAAGVDAAVHVEVLGDGGYFLGGMNKQAEITVHGNAGWSVAENIMSGVVRVKGSVSECAAASGHGGLVVIEGDASSRCGISMKGVDIVVGGNVGHMSAFMAQAGHLVVCGNAGPALGDSLYEAVLYVRGTIHGLGADARQEPLQDQDCQKISELLGKAGIQADPQSFKRIASAKSLYHWNVEANQEY